MPPQTFDRSEVDNDPGLAQDIAALFKKNEENPIQFFIPHGHARFAPDAGCHLVSALDWLNDDEFNFYMNKSPNRTGKSCLALVKLILRAIKTGADWPIFKKFGVKRPHWEGPKVFILYGYDKGWLRRTLWPEVQKWTPDWELGDYRRGGSKTPAWERHPEITLSESESRLVFMSYEQSASAGAGMVAHYAMADEQIPLSHFNEVDERGRNVSDLGTIWVSSYTPHKVEGRADTGTASWLDPMWDGTNTQGKEVLRTRITVDDVPEHLYPEKQKKAAYKKWVLLPKQRGDEAAMREGQARYYGISQAPAAVFYPEFSRNYHLITWRYDDLKKLPGRFARFLDYGWSAPTACLWVWISNMGEFVVYDEYYVRKKQAYDHAEAIIKQSGNIRKLVGQIGTHSGVMQQFKEQRPHLKGARLGGEAYERTELDWHCFSESGGGLSIARYFQLGGLPVQKSVEDKIEQRAQCLRSMLRVDQFRRHLVTGKAGAPRLYISTKCRHLVDEIEHCLQDQRMHGEDRHNPKETRQDKDDHLIDCLEYMAARYSKAIAVSRDKLKVIKKGRR